MKTAEDVPKKLSLDKTSKYSAKPAKLVNLGYVNNLVARSKSPKPRLASEHAQNLKRTKPRKSHEKSSLRQSVEKNRSNKTAK